MFYLKDKEIEEMVYGILKYPYNRPQQSQGIQIKQNYNMRILWFHNYIYAQSQALLLQQQKKISPHYLANKPLKDTHFFKVFQGLNSLIDVNECSYLVNDQLKTDKQLNNEAKILESVITVILQNK